MNTENIAKRRYYAKNVLFEGNADDARTIDKMVGFLNEVIFKQQAILTDFLNPGQRDILKILASDEFFLQEFGGYSGAEKKRVYISEAWADLNLQDFGVTACVIDYAEKFNRLTHSAILGTLANAGVENATFGDIITDGRNQWQVFVKTELADFFQEEIKRIGKTKVRLKKISLKKVLVPEDDSCTITIVVASPRLDAVLAGIRFLSRRQIKNKITENLVKLNWHAVKDSNIIVKVNDVLSLRYFGRCQISDIRTTRKGKYKVVLKLWQTKNHKQKK